MDMTKSRGESHEKRIETLLQNSDGRLADILILLKSIDDKLESIASAIREINRRG